MFSNVSEHFDPFCMFSNPGIMIRLFVFPIIVGSIPFLNPSKIEYSGKILKETEKSRIEVVTKEFSKKELKKLKKEEKRKEKSEKTFLD